MSTSRGSPAHEASDDPFTPEVEDWRVHRTLPDGTPIAIRPLVPSDKDALREAFAHLSVETRYMRFFGAVSEPSEKVLSYLTTVDQIDHVAIVATVESHDLKSERGVGVARFVRVAGEPHVAEAAVTVVDDMQRKGLGTALLVELTRAALARGVRVFRGEVLASNGAMMQILESVGAEIDPNVGAGDPAIPSTLARQKGVATRTFEVMLEPDTPRLDQAIVHAFRAAARSMATQLRSMFSEDDDERPAPRG